MLTLAELEKKPATSERRTMQFLIERACPVEGSDEDETGLLPCATWVNMPSEDPNPFSYIHEMCDGKHWELTRSAAAEFGIDGHRVWVCEHMGHLIE